MKIKTHKSFTITVDAKEYWLITRALATLNTDDIKSVLNKYKDGVNLNRDVDRASKLLLMLMNNIESNASFSTVDLYKKFKENGDFE